MFLEQDIMRVNCMQNVTKNYIILLRNVAYVLKSLYENLRVCIKHQGIMTDAFKISAGILQGEMLSPILFSMYLNDFERHFI